MTPIDFLVVLPWMDDALCAEPAYQDLPWFPERGQPLEPAKAVCRRCITRDVCLAYALEVQIGSSWVPGVWGGTSEQERATLRQAARGVAA